MIRIKLLLFFSMATTAQFVSFQANAQQQGIKHYMQPEWLRDYPPFRVAGNLYYVGSEDLACYLITTPKGHILINTGVEGSDTMIRRHVEMLGFKFTDIKILLATHGHFDHVGAMAAIKRETKAKMMMEQGDAALLEDGGNSDFDFGGKGQSFKPVKVDRELHDRDSILLGGMKIEVLHHPGHTKGASSFLFTVKDDKRSYKVLIANIPSILAETKFPSMPSYKNVQKDYTYTFDTMPKIQFDIWLASHAGQFNLQTKHHPGDPYNPMVFADRSGYDAKIKEMKEGFLERLKEKGK